jgi:DNA/RNA-binding domain of Phe-tRNA-synthetase-like protein
MNENLFRVAEGWESAYPDGCAGLLALHNVSNPSRSEALELRKSQLENELRSRYGAQDRALLRQDPRLQAYRQHYRHFDKSYHVQLQLESIVFKGKPLPSAAALVEAMFMSELEDLLLTAGHDLDVTAPPLELAVARGDESYVLMRGDSQSPKAGDMMISDSQGIISSVIYGPDQRTQITSSTRNAVFTTYAPPGIKPAWVDEHLRRIVSYAKLISPDCTPGTLQILPLK